MRSSSANCRGLGWVRMVPTAVDLGGKGRKNEKINTGAAETDLCIPLCSFRRELYTASGTINSCPVGVNCTKRVGG